MMAVGHETRHNILSCALRLGYGAMSKAQVCSVNSDDSGMSWRSSLRRKSVNDGMAQI
jgi:hypothetical protein